MMLIQRSAKDTRRTAVLAGQLAASASLVEYGALVRLGRDDPATLRTWLGSSGAALRIADPEAWTRGDQHAELSSNFTGLFPHLSMPIGARGSAAETAWLQAVVDAQLQVGARVVLSPGLWVGPGNGIGREVRLAAQTVGLAAGPPVWLNLALHRDHVIDPAARGRLLGMLVAAGVGDSGGPEAVYLRAQLPSYGPSYTEPRRRGYIDGLADLVKTLGDEGVPLILPNSGLTGWAMLGLGAHGFGAGVGWAQRVWLTPGGGRQGPGRYFKRELLHTVQAAEHLRIQAAVRGAACGCQWCAQLWSGGPGTMPIPWDYELAGLHYLEQLGTMTAALPALSPRARILRLVRVAQGRATQIASLPNRLLAGITPTHLPAWDRVLR